MVCCAPVREARTVSSPSLPLATAYRHLCRGLILPRSAVTNMITMHVPNATLLMGHDVRVTSMRVIGFRGGTEYGRACDERHGNHDCCWIVHHSPPGSIAWDRPCLLRLVWASHGSTASPSNRPTMIDFHITEHSMLIFDPGQAGGHLPLVTT